MIATTVTYEELSWRYGIEFEDKVGILIGWWEDEDRIPCDEIA